MAKLEIKTKSGSIYEVDTNEGIVKKNGNLIDIVDKHVNILSNDQIGTIRVQNNYNGVFDYNEYPPSTKIEDSADGAKRIIYETSKGIQLSRTITELKID